MRILVTGFTGYVGRMIYDYFAAEHEVFGTSSACQENGRNYKCDLRYGNEVRTLSSIIQPEVVIHAAGQKEIPFCENHVDEAFSVNSLSTENVAKAFGSKSRILYISTDYVFDGKTGNYSEDHIPDPLTVYGKSKVSGEQQGFKVAKDNFIVIRTAALYNDSSKFIEYLGTNLSNGQAVSCYTNTYYSPTYYVDLLGTLEALLSKNHDRQIYHVCGSRISRYEFAELVAEAYRYDVSLVRPALRPSENWFLLPDLSLSSSVTQSLLNYRQTPHEVALEMLSAKRDVI